MAQPVATSLSQATRPPNLAQRGGAGLRIRAWRLPQYSSLVPRRASSNDAHAFASCLERLSCSKRLFASDLLYFERVAVRCYQIKPLRRAPVGEPGCTDRRRRTIGRRAAPRSARRPDLHWPIARLEASPSPGQSRHVAGWARRGAIAACPRGNTRPLALATAQRDRYECRKARSHHHYPARGRLR
jgi:hypothetical protein